MPSLLEDIMHGAVSAARGLGHKVAARGLDAAFEDLESAGSVFHAEWTRRVQRARRRIKHMEEHPNERFPEDEDT